METRKEALERKIKEAKAKLVDIEAQLEPLEKLRGRQEHLISRIAKLSKELGTL